MEDVNTIKSKIVPILKKAGVTRSSLFGSVARGEAKKNSDIDILVELPKGKDLLDVVGLKLDLEDALGRKVDIVEYEEIKPAIRDNVLHDQIALL